MAISGNLPKHLEVGARTAALTSPVRDDFQYRRVAMELDLTQKTTDLVDLGGMPAPTNNPAVVDSLIEKTMQVTPKDWYLTLHISQNAIDDDQTGSLERNFRNLNPAFQRHLDSYTFTVLNAGDGTTYGSAYDTQDFFDSDHADLGASYTTSQDNEGALTLSLDNFDTALTAARQFVDDQGNYQNYLYNLLVCNTALERTAANICTNSEAYDTGNREMNPYSGRFTFFSRPELDSTAWYIIASSEPVKPIILGIRKRPTLHNMWFDSQQEDGGIHYFQYHARYVAVYGDWRLAYQGNT